MPTIPVRSLSKGGIIKDQRPSALPLGFFSDGRNVSFMDGKVIRSPVWKTVFGSLTGTTQFLTGYTPTNSVNEVILAQADGSLVRYRDGLMIPASESGFTPGLGALSGSWSSTQLGDVIYVSHPSMRLRALKPTDTLFAFDPQWDAQWRCGVIRQFQDAIVALNLTKGAAHIPSMVKVSDITFFGQTPQSWNSNDPTKLAYENELSQLDGPILDGLARDQEFLFYTAHQTWSMEANGSFTYQFRKLFSNAGILAANCVTEVGGLHYVFGANDLYATDGSTQKSLCDGRMRRWVYSNVDRRATDRCFVQFVPATNEVLFAFVSKDPSAVFKSLNGCNMAVAYNIGTDTLSIVDLNDIAAMSAVNAETLPTWATEPQGATWETLGPDWRQDMPTTARHVVGASGSVLGAYDFANTGLLNYPIAATLNAPAWVERIGMKLDGEDAGKAKLRDAKEWRSIVPEAAIGVTSGVFEISLGSSFLPDDASVYEPPMSFDPRTDYTVDGTSSGRALAVRFDFPQNVDAEVSGFDMDVVSNGGR